MPNEALANLQRLQAQMSAMSNSAPGEGGLISGPIKRHFREKRETAAGTELLAAEQQARNAGSSDVMLGAGFEFGPRSDTTPGQQKQLSAMGRAMSSSDPTTRAAGLENMRNLEASSGMNMTPADEQILANAKLNYESSKFSLEHAQELAPGQLALQRQQQVAAGLGIENAQADLSAKIFDAANPAPVPTTPMDLTKPQVVFNPFTGGGSVAFVPGTKEHSALQGQSNSAQFLLNDVGGMMADIDDYGSERWNDEAVGRMQSRHAGMLIKLNTLREAGVPSGAELELAARSLPDPTTFGKQFQPGRKDRWMEAYRQVERELTRSIMGLNQMNPMLHTDYSLFNPTDVSPEMQEFYKANTPTLQGVLTRGQ